MPLPVCVLFKVTRTVITVTRVRAIRSRDVTFSTGNRKTCCLRMHETCYSSRLSFQALVEKVKGYVRHDA